MRHQQIWNLFLQAVLFAGSLSAQVQDRTNVCSLQNPPARHSTPFGHNQSVALVMQLGGKYRAIDDQVAAHLKDVGFAVTEVDQADAPNHLDRYALVLLSSSVSARYLRETLKSLAVPLITWEYQMLDQLGMTGKRLDVDSGMVEKEHNLSLVNAPHPLSAAIPAGKMALYTNAGPMSWGKPGLGASIIATLPGQPERAAIFAYEKGATMDYDFLAPARRVFLPLADQTFPQLNPCGKELFDAALEWAIASPSAA